MPAALLLMLAVVGATAGLTGCTKKADKVEDIRPVRALTLTAANEAGGGAIVEYPGEVRARITSRLGFRVGGKIIERKVDVGSVVRRGQVLMRLDPQDLQLAQRQTDAALQSAIGGRDLAQAELRRYQELRNKNFVSQATLDAKLNALQSAQAAYDQAQAAARNQSNQTGYGVLAADSDGVVTSVDAEAGQVVAAGTPVVSVAQDGPMDVVIGVPEDRIGSLQAGRRQTAGGAQRQVQDQARDQVQVRLWSEPDRVLRGKIREVSPIADPATRTYAVKVALEGAPASVRLGMTATVGFAAAAAGGAAGSTTGDAAHPTVRLPLTALRPVGNGLSAVWVVEDNAVRSVPVAVVGETGNDALVSGGVRRGQTIVTAGVNLLQPGQKVAILGAEPIVAGSGKAAGAAAAAVPAPAATGNAK